MSFTNFESKEVNCKILLFGPHQAGKSTNFASYITNLSQEIKSGAYILQEGEKAPFFEFLPVSMGEVEGFHIKLHLYSVPNYWPSPLLQSVFFRGVDGFLFVADSRAESMVSNLESMRLARSQLLEAGYAPNEMPHVLQYNKRDLQSIMPLTVLREALNHYNVPDIESVATKSIGTMECLEQLAKQVLVKFSAEA